MNELLLGLLAALGVVVGLAWRAAARRRSAPAQPSAVPVAETAATTLPAEPTAPASDELAEAEAELERIADAAAAERDRAARQRAEQEQAEALARAEAERRSAEQAKQAREHAEREAQAAHEREAAGRAAAERAAAEAAARAEAQRQAELRAEAERLAAELAERERLAAAQAEAERLAAQRVPVAAKSATQLLVMVADDSKVVRIKTGRLLAAHQYQVCYANDGLEAVQLLRTQTPDVVITDVEMPGMDGFELTRHIRSQAATARLPVIMITAADERHREHAEQAGVSVLLGKPYPEDALIAHIRQAVGEAAAAAAIA